MRVQANGNESPFEFSLNQGAQKYYNDARKDRQGAIAAFEQSIVDLGVQGRIGTDRTRPGAIAEQRSVRRDQRAVRDKLTEETLLVARAEYDLAVAEAPPLEQGIDSRRQAIQAATARYLDTLKSVRESLPADDATQISELPDASATLSSNVPSQGSSGGLLPTEPGFKLLDSMGDTDSVVSNRSAIITAAGDSTVEGIFRVLGNPAEAARYSGRSVFFGVTMVSVTPGHRTRRKFSADVAISVGLSARDVPIHTLQSLASTLDVPLTVKARLACDVGAFSCKDGTLTDLARYLGASEGEVASSERRPEVKNRFFGAIGASIQLPTKEKLNVPDVAEVWRDVPSLQRGEYLVMRRAQGQKVGASYRGATQSMSCRAFERHGTLRCQFLTDTPQVAAVSPMTEAQVLDLGSSQRQRMRIATDLASALARAGDSRSARVFAEFAKQAGRDAVSRTPQNLVTGYSSGSVVGYQVGPGFRALADLSSADAGGDLELQRQSFPALLLFGVRSEVARPLIHLVGWSEDKDDQPSCDTPTAGDSCRLAVLRPYLDMQQTARWSPRRTLFSPWFRISETEWAKSATTLLEARSTSADVAENLEWGIDDAMEVRRAVLRTMLAPQPTSVPIPEEAPSKADVANLSISPAAWTLSVQDDAAESATFVIKGSGLDRDGLKCRASGKGVPQIREPQSVAGNALVCQFEFKADNAGSTVIAIEGPGKQRWLAGVIEVKKTPGGPKKEETEPVLKYQVKSSAGTIDHAVFGSKGSAVPIEVARDLIRADIEKSKAGPAANVSVSVQASDVEKPSSPAASAEQRK
jgi:hypothetical protein